MVAALPLNCSSFSHPAVSQLPPRSPLSHSKWGAARARHCVVAVALLLSRSSWGVSTFTLLAHSSASESQVCRYRVCWIVVRLMHCFSDSGLRPCQHHGASTSLPSRSGETRGQHSLSAVTLASDIGGTSKRPVGSHAGWQAGCQIERLASNRR